MVLVHLGNQEMCFVRVIFTKKVYAICKKLLEGEQIWNKKKVKLQVKFQLKSCNFWSLQMIFSCITSLSSLPE